jgi:hypothetical protein
MNRTFAIFCAFAALAVGVGYAQAQFVSPLSPETFKCGADSECGTPAAFAVSYRASRSPVSKGLLDMVCTDPRRHGALSENRMWEICRGYPGYEYRPGRCNDSPARCG